MQKTTSCLPCVIGHFTAVGFETVDPFFVTSVGTAFGIMTPISYTCCSPNAYIAFCYNPHSISIRRFSAEHDVRLRTATLEGRHWGSSLTGVGAVWDLRTPCSRLGSYLRSAVLTTRVVASLVKYCAGVILVICWQRYTIELGSDSEF